MRLAPLLAVGVLMLHKIDAVARGGAMAGHGHSYLPLAAALATVLLVLTCVRYTRELWQVSRGRATDVSQPSLRWLWLVASAALLTTFGLQEWIEGWVTPGHPGTIPHALSHLGWLSPLLAVAIGGVMALVLQASQTAIVLLTQRHAARRTPRAERGRWALVPHPTMPRLAVLAGNRAGRAPPAVSFT